MAKSESRYQPKDMLVGVTNRCNHECVFCPHQIMTQECGEIDPVLLKRILQEAYDMGVRRVGLYTVGEMFLCKEIVTHVKNAKEIGYEYIYGDTNGALATKERMREVFLAGLDSLKFSINAGTRESYHFIHGRDQFETVLQNVKNCHDLKEELGLNFKIMVSFVATTKTESEVDLLRKALEPYLDEFVVHNAVNIIKPYEHPPTDMREYLYKEESGKREKDYICSMVFDRIHITHDGFLTACCQDFNHDLLLADLKTTSLRDAWNGEKFEKFRERHLTKKLEGTLCHGCMVGDYRPYKPLIP